MIRRRTWNREAKQAYGSCDALESTLWMALDGSSHPRPKAVSTKKCDHLLRTLSGLTSMFLHGVERGLGLLVVFLCVPVGCILLYEIVQIRKCIYQTRAFQFHLSRSRKLGTRLRIPLIPCTISIRFLYDGQHWSLTRRNDSNPNDRSNSSCIVGEDSIRLILRC